MPIDYGIDRERRLVVCAPYGILTDQDIFGYQRDVWSLPEVAGFDEFVDMSAVEHIALPHAKRVEDLARLASQMDAESGAAPGRMAIFASSDIAFGLGRMFQAHREMRSRGRPPRRRLPDPGGRPWATSGSSPARRPSACWGSRETAPCARPYDVFAVHHPLHQLLKGPSKCVYADPSGC